MKPAFAAYLIAIHLLLGASVVKGDLVRKAGVHLGLLEAQDDPFIALMHRLHGWMDAQVPPGSVLFLGDSITQSLVTSSVAPLSVNYGVAGQRSDQLLGSMHVYASMERASAVVLMIGTNDLYRGREQGIEARYRAILAKVPAGVPVVLSSIPPMAGKDARPVVEAAHLACRSDPRCTFVNAYKGISTDMLLADRVHLGRHGYAVWASLLRESLSKLRVRPNALEKP